MKDENSKMLELIEKFPDELKAPFTKSKLTSGKRYDSIVVCGMGGSAIAGMIVKDVFKDLDIKVVTDYILPKIKGKPIVITCSYSGNTQETLSCFEQARRLGYDVLGISSGGKLLQLCKENNLDWIELKPGIPPRIALPNLFSSILKVLETKGFLPSQKGSIDNFIKYLDFKKLKENAKGMANYLKGKIPVIYTYDFPAVAKRVKDEFNENAKIHSRVELFPELNHNDINSWLDRKMSAHSKLLFLRSNEEPEQISKVMEVTEKILLDKADISKFEMRGNNRLEKALNTILVFDITSVYLAELNNTDSYSVKIIEEFKKMLS